MSAYRRTPSCACDLKTGAQCAWHAGHPVTDNVATIEANLRDAEARYAQAVAEIDKCQDGLRSWARARNQAEERISTLRSDLRIARNRA